MTTKIEKILEKLNKDLKKDFVDIQEFAYSNNRLLSTSLDDVTSPVHKLGIFFKNELW